MNYIYSEINSLYNYIWINIAIIRVFFACFSLGLLTYCSPFISFTPHEVHYPGGTPYNGLNREVSPVRGTFLRPSEVYEKRDLTI